MRALRDSIRDEPPETDGCFERLGCPAGALGTWMGSTLGLVVADALAIGVGALLGKQIPEQVIKWGAAALFAVFGLILIADGVLGFV